MGVITVPIALLAVVKLNVGLDAAWENHPAHFWLVLAAAGIASWLGHGVTVAGRKRYDARLFLIGVAFVAGAAFLGLHALATPGVLVGPNAGFELATPVGLVLGGALVAASSVELSPDGSQAVMRHARTILAALVALILLWAAVSLAEVPPLDQPLESGPLQQWQIALGVAGPIAYAIGAVGYLQIYRRRHTRFLLVVVLAMTLLAEAMIVIVFARNWRISWWEWHVLMLGAFAAIALAARREWHEERFAALYLDHTLAGSKEVSVLFADLQGYTTYSESKSPSDVTAMLNTYFAQLVPLMERYRGQVHQLIGDAIMVVFNKDGQSPDHPLLAAQAGLALQNVAKDIADHHPSWPRFRVGVNSGEVMTGVVGGERGHRKHDVIGDTVNLASRLEGQAPVGGVVIGEGTYDALPAGTHVERLAPLTVKGKSEPVTAYVLHEVPVA